MRKQVKISVGIILIISGIGQLVFISLNRDEILWSYRGQFLDYEGSVLLSIPPNPIVGNSYVMKVSADFYDLYYMHYSNSGNINFTHQETKIVFEFNYYLTKANGDVDYEKIHCVLIPGIHNISWTNQNCAYMYDLIKVGIGYPHNNYIFLSSIIITVIITILSLAFIGLALEILGKSRKIKK
ncbi:MAG: hypothetical protein ACFE8N_02940 [Promethearchaeota archaeon]